jgi:nucleoside 2-deoxyribosyltransferase
LLRDIRKAIKEAVQQFNVDHPNAQLSPTCVDEQKGDSYEIPRRVFGEIDNSRLLIADLTDEKPNVYCEVGYAMSRGIPFILTFQKESPKDRAPWDRKIAGGKKVHFDLTAFRRIEYNNPMDLRDKLKVELDEWHLTRT